MDGPRAWVATVVLLLIVGAAVWALRAQPLFSLLAILGGVGVWEAGRRSRYRHSLRFLPPPRSEARGGPTRATPRVRARSEGARPPWQRSSGAFAPRGRPSPPRPRPGPRATTQRRP